MGNQLYRGRVSLKNQIYHITSCSHERSPIFTNFKVARIVINEMKQIHSNDLVSSLAWVVMPDHIHWLFQLTGNEPLSNILKIFKARSALKIKQNCGLDLHKVWQKGFHDHAIRKEESIKKIARYIVANPLRAGLVKNISDYPHWDAIWLNPM